MGHGRLVLISAFVAALAAPAPAEAQSPRRLLGPLAAPFGMMLRALPRVHRPRAYRAPRAIHRRPRIDRQMPAVARPAPNAQRQFAQTPIGFWPIAAPGAFEDMLGYALWPGEYGRQFWSHGPRDILQAMTAPRAAFASAGGLELPRLVGSAHASGDERSICIARVKEQAVKPLDRIAQAISLTPHQQQKLDNLRSTVRAAIEAETAACRSDIPATQPERLRAMIDGLWAMRYAEFRIRPALEEFHAALSDAQRVQLAEGPTTVGSTAESVPGTPAAVCRAAVAAEANPFEPIARALRPTDEQRKSLQALYGASMDMAQFLTRTCPAETPSTPMTRLDAAGDRLMALLHAAMNIEPMLEAFYARLNDSQRRRFNSVIR